MINKKRLLQLTQDLIRINSENPPGNEASIAGYINYFLDIRGIQVKNIELARGRTNVIAFREGRGKKTLLISPHLDTVPSGSGWKYNALSGSLINGRIYGRGATDCKGNLAVALEVLRSICEDNVTLDVNLILAACADEETGSKYGIKGLLDRNILMADAALILDSDNFDIIVAQKGLIHLKLRIYGLKAHGAFPQNGKNAINIASFVIRDLEKYKIASKAHPLLKPPTINIGTIIGGDKVNIVADWCEVGVDIRFLPGMKASSILAWLKRLIRRHTHDFEIEVQDLQKPYEISSTHPIVKGLKYSCAAVGVKAKIKGSEGATVITFFQDKNIPAIATGFGTEGCAHVTDEYVKLRDLYKGAVVLEDFLKNFSCD